MIVSGEQSLQGKQARALQVLKRITKAVESDPAKAIMYSAALDPMLNSMCSSFKFGFDGRDDPRGDRRLGEWNMSVVQMDSPLILRIFQWFKRKS